MAKYGTENKYYESRQRAIMKYDAKTYRKINVALRIDEDADVIESMDYARDNGIPLRVWLSDIFHYGGSPREVIPEGLVKLADVEKALMQARLDYRTVQQIMESLK